MTTNPANYAAGLLDEREAAVRAGDEQAVADIEAELDSVRDALEAFDPAGVDEAGQRKAVAAVRRRLAALDNGEDPQDASDPAEPRLHNPANYMAGLLDEHAAALRADRPTGDIEAEIEKVRPHLDSFQPLDDEAGAARAHFADTKRRLAAHSRSARAGKSEGPQDGDGEKGPKESGKSGPARTVKAAAAPRTATAPPAQ